MNTKKLESKLISKVKGFYRDVGLQWAIDTSGADSEKEIGVSCGKSRKNYFELKVKVPWGIARSKSETDLFTSLLSKTLLPERHALKFQYVISPVKANRKGDYFCDIAVLNSYH